MREAIRDQGYRKFVPREYNLSDIFDDKEKIKQVKDKAKELIGSLRCYSLHCGGIVIFPDNVPDNLKDKYKSETAYLVTCGPSLANHDDNILMDKLRDKLVLSVKQAHDVVGDISDFHLLNTYNLKEYHYLVENTIVVWSVSKSYAYNQLQRIQNKPLDIYFPVINPP